MIFQNRFAAGFLIACISFSASSGAQNVERVLISFDGGQITSGDMHHFYHSRAKDPESMHALERESVLRRLGTIYVLAREARKREYDKTSSFQSWWQYARTNVLALTVKKRLLKLHGEKNQSKKFNPDEFFKQKLQQQKKQIGFKLTAAGDDLLESGKPLDAFTPQAVIYVFDKKEVSLEDLEGKINTMYPGRQVTDADKITFWKKRMENQIWLTFEIQLQMVLLENSVRLSLEAKQAEGLAILLLEKEIEIKKKIPVADLQREYENNVSWQQRTWVNPAKKEVLRVRTFTEMQKKIEPHMLQQNKITQIERFTKKLMKKYSYRSHTQKNAEAATF